jgi:hypothetical protein
MLRAKIFQLEFGAWILAGLFIFVLLPVWGKQSLCAPQQNPSIVRQQEQPKEEAKQSETSALQGTLQLWLCSEARMTDILIAYFTYCLAIVGWFGIRSDQRTVEDLERAYLWPGFGKSEPIAPHGRRWFVRVHNTGHTAGVIQTVYHALVLEEDFKAGRFTYEPFDGRENVIPPAFGPPIEEKTGIVYEIYRPMISCGWIVYEDTFNRIRRRGWKHRLNLIANSAGNYSDSLPGCYSAAYRPWKTAKMSDQS